MTMSAVQRCYVSAMYQAVRSRGFDPLRYGRLQDWARARWTYAEYCDLNLMICGFDRASNQGETAETY